MERSRSLLRLGCPVRFRDRWQGRLTAIEVDEQWLVLNLTVSHGAFRRAEVKLPFATAGQWDYDAISFDCTSYEAFGRRIPPVAVPPRPLSDGTPLSVAGVGFAGALVGLASRRAGHLLLRRGRSASDRRLVPVEAVSLEGGVVKLSAPWDALAPYRPDADLLRDARDAVARHPRLTAADRRRLHVDVVEGTAHVSGNVRTSQARVNVCDAVSSVPGIAAVRADIFDDARLETEIGRALDAAGLFRHGRIYARAALGDVTLSGFVASEAVVADILRAVSAVPGVRSVEDRMEVGRTAPSGPRAVVGASPAVEPERAAGDRSATEA